MLESFSPLIPYLSFLSMLISLVFMLLFSILSSKDFKKEFSEIKKSTWLILIVIFIFSLYTLSTFPNVFNTLHDEYSFGQYAIRLLNGDARFYDSFIGYQIFISFVFLVFGPDLWTMYAINTILGSLSIILVFFVSYLFFGKEEAGLYAALLFALFPLNVVYFNTLESSASAVFFALLTLFYFLFYLKVKTRNSQLLAALSLAFTMFFRLEFLILPFLFGFMVFLSDTNLKKHGNNFRYWLPWIVLLILIIPAFLQVLWNVYPFFSEGEQITFSNPDYGIFSLKALSENANKSTLFFISDLFPSYLAILFFLGLLFAFVKNRRKFIFMITWILLLTTMYLSYWIIWLRHLLPVYLMVIILWGGGACFVADIFKKFLHKFLNKKFDLFVLLAALLLIFISFSPKAYALGGESYSIVGFWIQREVYLEREAVYFLNQNLGRCTIVMVDTEGLISKNLKPVRVEYVIENPQTVEEMSKDGCLLYFEDLYCKVPETIYAAMEEVTDNYKRLCNQMHEEFNLTVYRRFNVTLPEAYKNFKPEVIQTYWADFTLYNISSK